MDGSRWLQHILQQSGDFSPRAAGDGRSPQALVDPAVGEAVPCSVQSRSVADAIIDEGRHGERASV